jgi:putative transcriptional regulator
MAIRGRLLVATPQLLDPNFSRTVVLVVEHDGDGAFGVVVNRATDVPVAETFASWTEVTSAPAVVFRGGPVHEDRAIGLGMRDHSEPGPRWAPLIGELGCVDLGAGPTGPFRRFRVFAGSSGWGPGQLEREIDEGSWFVVDAQPESDVFSTNPDRLWADVLRRQPGRLAWFANAPEDLSAN